MQRASLADRMLPPRPDHPVRVFVASSEKDEAALKKLESYLFPLAHKGGLAEVFTSRSLLPGVRWKDEIMAKLGKAEIIVLLVSQDFLSSEACDDELETAIALADQRRALLLPVLVQPCLWETSSLAGIQFATGSTVPLDERHSPEGAWKEVANDFLRLVEDALARRRSIETLCAELAEKTAAHTGELLISHFPRRVFRPDAQATDIAQLMVPLQVEDLTAPSSAKTPGGETVLALLRDPRPARHVLLEGGPGSGKTPLAIHVAHELLREAAGGRSAKPIPLLLQLRDAPTAILTAKASDSPSPNARERASDPPAPNPLEEALIAWLVAEMGTRLRMANIDEERVRLALGSGRVVLVIDGLDHLGSDALKRDFCAVLPKTAPAVLTCRHGSFQPPDATTLHRLRLRPFTNDQLRDYLERWCALTTPDAGAQALLFSRLLLSFGLTRRTGPSMALEWTPQLAAYLAASHQSAEGVPNSRTEVYERFLSWLFNATLDPNRAPLDAVDGPLLRLLLIQVAHRMVCDRRRELPREELKSLLAKLAGDEGVELHDRWLDYLIHETGILVERAVPGAAEPNVQVGFAHVTLQEYLAGQGFRHLRADNTFEGVASLAVTLLDSSAGYAWWSEPLLLAFSGVADRRRALAVIRRVLQSVQDLTAALSQRGDDAPAPEAAAWEYLLFALALVAEMGAFPAVLEVLRELLDELYECCTYSEERLSILGEKSRADVAAIAGRLDKLARSGDPRTQDLLRAWFADFRAKEKALPPAQRHARIQKWGLLVPAEIVGAEALAELRAADPPGYVQILKLWPHSDLALFAAEQPRCDEIVSWACADTPFHLIALRALESLERTWDDGAAAWTVALLRRAAWMAHVTRIACAGHVEDPRSSLRFRRDARVGVVHLRPSVVPSEDVKEKATDSGHRLETQLTEGALRRVHSRMKHDENHRPAMRRVAEAFSRAFAQKLPKKLVAHVQQRPSLIESLQETWIAALPERGGLRLPYGPDVAKLLRGAPWRCDRFVPLAASPSDRPTEEPSEDASSERADAVHLKERLLIRHWLETLTGVVIGVRSGVENGWLLGSLRSQNLWFYWFWDDLAEFLGADIERQPGHVALLLAAALAQYQTTWRWPSGRAWSRWFPDAPAKFHEEPKRYWLARCAWHLCWTVSGHDPKGVHQRGLYAALRDGDGEWPVLATTLRNLNVKAP